MDLTNLTRSIIRSEKSEPMIPLDTPWSEQARTQAPKCEYPRPQFVRKNYASLNGIWGFSISDSAEQPERWNSSIRVPFSPESDLSVVTNDTAEKRNILPHILQPDEFLWYHKNVRIPERPAEGSRLLLHFGAVDQICDVFIGKENVAHHEGGYLPFTIDVTDHVKKESEKENGSESAQNSFKETIDLNVRVIDITDTSWLSRGKQTLKRGGMFYSPQSGIWQSVWMEWVPDTFIARIMAEPKGDLKKVKIRIFLNKPADVRIRHLPMPNGTVLFDKTLTADEFTPCDPLDAQTDHSMPSSDTIPFDTTYAYVAVTGITIENAKCWSPEDPYLYHMEVLAKGGDRVESYFAMRTFTIENDSKNYPRFCLNHKPYFLRGVLDQGYWPDGLLTAPSDKALIYDIKTMKKLGFNMMRKHVKIEEARWYYHCDRLGMIVFQDMVSGGTTYDKPLVTYLPNLFPKVAQTLDDSAKSYAFLSRSDAAGRHAFVTETRNAITYLKNVPSIGTWVLFNEGWGQFDAATLPRIMKFLDSSRPFDAASGWFDQYSGDYLSIHNYFRRPGAPRDNYGRACLLSECGGFTYYARNHSTGTKAYGYQIFKRRKELEEAYGEYIYTEVLPLEAKGLAGFVYTQVSDVEDEVNGIMTYDRRIVKIRQKIYR